MDIVNRTKLERLGLPADDEALAAMSDALRKRLDAEIDRALRHRAAVGRRHHRPARHAPHAGLCLAVAREAEARTLRPNTFGIARF